MLINEVGLQIKNLRKEKLKLSQSEFAKKLDWDRIFCLESKEESKILPLDTLEKICLALDVSIKEFFC